MSQGPNGRKDGLWNMPFLIGSWRCANL